MLVKNMCSTCPIPGRLPALCHARRAAALNELNPRSIAVLSPSSHLLPRRLSRFPPNEERQQRKEARTWSRPSHTASALNWANPTDQETEDDGHHHDLPAAALHDMISQPVAESRQPDVNQRGGVRLGRQPPSILQLQPTPVRLEFPQSKKRETDAASPTPLVVISKPQSRFL
jgi:hypothetical protein